MWITFDTQVRTALLYRRALQTILTTPNPPWTRKAWKRLIAGFTSIPAIWTWDRIAVSVHSQTVFWPLRVKRRRPPWQGSYGGNSVTVRETPLWKTTRSWSHVCFIGEAHKFPLNVTVSKARHIKFASFVSMMDSYGVTQLIYSVIPVIGFPMESLQSIRFKDHDIETNREQKLGRVHDYPDVLWALCRVIGTSEHYIMLGYSSRKIYDIIFTNN